MSKNESANNRSIKGRRNGKVMMRAQYLHNKSSKCKSCFAILPPKHTHNLSPLSSLSFSLFSLLSLSLFSLFLSLLSLSLSSLFSLSSLSSLSLSFFFYLSIFFFLFFLVPYFFSSLSLSAVFFFSLLKLWPACLLDHLSYFVTLLLHPLSPSLPRE